MSAEKITLANFGSNQNSFDQYQIDYLCERYEKLQDMALNNQIVSPAKIELMKRAFDTYDKDGSGVLNREEVTALLVNHMKEQGIKKKVSDADVDQFFSRLDDDHSG